MPNEMIKLSAAKPGDLCVGFRLVKKEYVASREADLYTLRHEKTGTELLYFDRADENKTFAISFKTLPENDTGVFHILEHSVLNGSRKFPVKEPFVSMLQSSMQTFLNALTYSDKTLYPVSSRNEQDLFNLMAVYLDAVFCPLIYEKPEIFMQEGWHYEFDEESGAPSYNGVVFSEMKGAFADVDSLMGEELSRLLFPDTSYGYISGGHPEHIPELTYQQFVDTHKRFYHPSNARIFLDGHMDVDRALAYIDGEYLSHYDYRAPDFDFRLQTPKPAERTICYEAREGEEELAHLAAAKILCTHADVEKTYAAKILANYLTGSNEAPLTRAFLERGLAQDVSVDITDGVYQPSVALLVRNTGKEQFAEIKSFLTGTVRRLVADGLDKQALMAALERFAFSNREIREPYGVVLAARALNGWLYGDDPLTHIDNAAVFDALRAKVDTDYFADLLMEMLGQPETLSYLYALPSLTKGQEDARREAERVEAIAAQWSDDEYRQVRDGLAKMQQWQQSKDSDEVLATLPHLELADVPERVESTEKQLMKLGGTPVLAVRNPTNGIVYLNLFFDVSDFTVEELRELNALTSFFGELRTEHYSALELQTKIKATLGSLYMRVDLISKLGDRADCKPYLLVSASMLEENAADALALIQELLLFGRYDETDRISETLAQNDYFMKQALIGNGHVFAITKALSAGSREGALKELLEGENFVNWFSGYAEQFTASPVEHAARFAALTARAFARSRLFVGFSGALDTAAVEKLISALPTGEVGAAADCPSFDNSPGTIEIPGDVGFSALGGNLAALGSAYTGSCSVLASLMTYGYLWNAVRVQGGAYGTGMSIRASGDLFCYSYRDPNLENTRAAFNGMADFLSDALAQGMPLDDLIIGTVNTTDPLLDPSGVCELECTRQLRGITPDDIARIRREILHTTPDDLLTQLDALRTFQQEGKFCAVGNHDAVAFLQ